MPTYLYDGTLVLGNLMNAAADLGVDSCWIHRAKEEFETQEGKELLKSLGIEGDYEGIGHLVLGYAGSAAEGGSTEKSRLRLLYSIKERDNWPEKHDSGTVGTVKAPGRSNRTTPAFRAFHAYFFLRKVT